MNGMAQILPDYLEPGGTVIVNLLVADGLIFRMVRLVALNRMWQAGLPSPHLSYFTGKTLQQLFEAAGFSCVRQGQLQPLSSTVPGQSPMVRSQLAFVVRSFALHLFGI